MWIPLNILLQLSIKLDVRDVNQHRLRMKEASYASSGSKVDFNLPWPHK